MPLPRFIPKPVFQVVALLLLLAALGIAVQIIWENDAPCAWLTGALDDRRVAGLLLLLAALVAWMLVALPLRRMSTIPTLREEMARLGVASISDMMDLAVQRTREQSELPAAGNDRPPLQRRHHARLALGATLCFVIFGVVAAANIAVAPRTVLLAPPGIAIVGLLLAPYHLVRMALIRKE